LRRLGSGKTAYLRTRSARPIPSDGFTGKGLAASVTQAVSSEHERPPGQNGRGRGDGLPPRVPLVVICVLALAGFVAGVYSYASYGGRFVARLSGEVGDVVSQRAKSFADEGDVETAIATYRQALELPFDDPRHRGWALRSFAELLTREKRPQEAIPVLQECLAAFPDDLNAHAQLCTALRRTEQFADALAAAERWYRAATEAGNALHRSLAKYHEGSALEAMGRRDDALAAYLESYSLDQTSVGAFHGAQLLHERGQEAQALQMLDVFIEHGSGWRLESALKLRSRIKSEIAKAADGAGDDG